MQRQLVVRPGAFRQFGEPAETFCLVTDADFVDDFILDDSGPDGNGGRNAYQKILTVPVHIADDLGKILSTEIPAAADVVVICRRRFVSSTDTAAIGDGRRVVVMPCASTPVSLEQIRYFLAVVGRTDPGAQARRAERFFEAAAESGGMRLVDEEQGATCALDPTGGDYVWNQQAGFLGPGEQQIAPAGELSVLPMEITDFDPGRRLALDGTFAVRGPTIVHAGYDSALIGEQAGLHERLAPLPRNPVLLDIRDGVIAGVRASGQTTDAMGVVAAFDELFTEDPRYRTIWELGFGINTEMATVSGNCGLNEPYGATDGVVHIGLGLTPYTRFALTFLCPGTVLVDSSENIVLGQPSRRPNAGRRPRRIKRTYGAGCGCH